MDLIEFATAALYTSEEQPMRAHTFHRLLLHPATTTGRLLGPQQQAEGALPPVYVGKHIIALQTRGRHFNSLLSKQAPGF